VSCHGIELAVPEREVEGSTGDAALPMREIGSGYALISDRAGYLRAITAIRAGVGPIAVDAERASGYRYSQRAHLIQVFRRGAGIFLFDAPAIGRFDELQDAIGTDEWVLHAASQDLACLREVGLSPGTIFDTELAARLLGLPRVGLGTVVRELLGIHLAKEHSASDWSVRPLPEAWLKYAALDVELLVDLRDAIRRMLVDAGKSEIAAAEFAHVLAKDPAPLRHEPWRRLSGIHSFRNARQLAVARELWLARDDLARELDLAPGRLVPDSALVAVAKTAPATKVDLQSLSAFTGRASRSEIDRWWSAIERGASTRNLPELRQSSESLPPQRSWAEKNPRADMRLRHARAAVTDIATNLSIPLENLLAPEILRRVSWEPPGSGTDTDVRSALMTLGARRWQSDLVAEGIARAFVDASQMIEEPVERDS